MGRSRWILAMVAGAAAAIAIAAPVFADNCSSELDCQQTQTYNTTTTVIGTAIAIAVAVISIIVSQAATAAGAAAAGTLPPPDGGTPPPDAPPTTDVIVEGQQAIDILIANGLITPIVRADGSIGYVPATDDMGGNPNVKGVAWTDNPDGTMNNPVIIVPGAEGPATEPPPEPPPPPPPPPPPLTDPPTENGMNQGLSGTTLGEAATKYVKDHNIAVVFSSADGSYWDAPHNRIIINAKDNGDAGQILVHEVNHAEGNATSNTAWNGGSKQNYVDTMIDQETQGTVESIQNNRQLRDNGTTPSQTFPLESQYNAARDKAIRDYRAAHPDATDAEVDKAGDDAGYARVKRGFENGEVQASTNGQSYKDYYGDSYDRAHPPRPAGGP